MSFAAKTTQSSQSAAKKTIPLYLIYFVYFLAGITALSYEVLWARMLSLIFGVSVFGIAITVSAFMAGLGAGSIAGTRWRVAAFRPLLQVALIEALVAIFSFYLPNLLSFYSVNSSSLSLTTWYWLHGLTSFFVLFVPAFLLGVGFTSLIRTLATERFSLPILYGANTIGGVLGAVLPIILLPTFGWTVSLRLVAIIGFTVSALFILCNRLYSFDERTYENTVAPNSRLPIHYYIAYGLVGFSALVIQVSWTRLYGMLFLRTEYVLAIILAVFLSGIGIGSIFAPFLRSRLWLMILPVLVVVFGIFELISLPWLGGLAEHQTYKSLTESLVTSGILIGIATLPITLIFGIWYPYLSTLLNANAQQAARLYGANSIGAAAGALISAFVLIPSFGTTGSLVFALLLLIGISFIWYEKKYLIIAAVFAIPLLVLFFKLPPLNRLQPEFFKNSVDLYFSEDAINITHVVEKESGEKLLLADLQRMDASTEPSAIATQKNQARLPLMLHPNPKSVLFLGLGTGITAAGSLPYPELRRVAVEISEGAIEAATTWFRVENENIVTSLELVRDDVRRYLQYTNEKYDVVIGDLFHPDLVGRSSLLSTQQFQRVQRVLSADGVYVQWLAINQFDPESLTVVLRTFGEIFQNSYLFIDGFRIAMVSLPINNSISENIVKNLSLLTDSQQTQATGDEGMWTWFGRYVGKIKFENGPIQDEWQPVIEFSIPKARYSKSASLGKTLDEIIKKRDTVDQAAATLKIPNESRESFERAYFATELWVSGMSALLQSNTTAAQRFFRLAFDANPKDRWVTTSLADQMFSVLNPMNVSDEQKISYLEKLLEIKPDHIEALNELRKIKQARGESMTAKQIEDRILTIYPGYRLK